MTDHAFAFDPQPGLEADTVDYPNLMTLSASFGSFFDDVFMTKLSFTQQGNPNAEYSFGMLDSARPETVDPRYTFRSKQPENFLRWRIPRISGRNSPEYGRCTNRRHPAGEPGHGPDPSRTTRWKQALQPKQVKETVVRCPRAPKKCTDAEEARRREQNLEKNRIAANKCRQKKKNWMAKMDDRHRNLAARNRFLKAEVGSLSKTVLELKELVFQHVECGYAPIGEYVKAEAQRVQFRNRSQSQAWIPMDWTVPQPQPHPGTSSAFGFPNNPGVPQLRSPPSSTQPTDLREITPSPRAAGGSQSWLGP